MKNSIFQFNFFDYKNVLILALILYGLFVSIDNSLEIQKYSVDSYIIAFLFLTSPVFTIFDISIFDKKFNNYNLRNPFKEEILIFSFLPIFNLLFFLLLIFLIFFDYYLQKRIK